MSPKINPVVRETPTFIEAARRAQIIEAALATIADLGFMNASLAQIARRAGISKGVIGYYFPTKDDLVKAVVDSFYMTGHETMMAQLSTATTATELLRRYITHNLAYIDENRVATRAIGDIIANFRNPDGTNVYQPEDAEPLVAGTAEMFRWGQQTAEFREFDVTVMAVMLRGCIDAFGNRLNAQPDLDVALYRDELVAMFVAATRKTT